MIEKPVIAPENLDSSTRHAWRVQIARLPLSMQPALNQQVDTWDNLFPFEQRRAAEFLLLAVNTDEQWSMFMSHNICALRNSKSPQESLQG